MALEFIRTPDQVTSNLTGVATSFGFTRPDRFIGAFIDTFSEIFSSLYGQLQSLDPQTRIDTATGAYLESWGLVLDEQKQRVTGMEDQSLDNVYVTTESGLPVTNYTVGATPLFIPNGAQILGTSGRAILATVDDLIIDNVRAFTRVVGIPGGTDNVASGTYRIQGGLQDFVMGRNSGALASAGNVVEDTNLVAVIQRPIIGNVVPLNDDEYRFILFSKANSINLSNKDKVNVALGNPQVARFVIREFVSGSSSVVVYVEPTVGFLSKPIEEAMKLTLNSLLGYGTLIRVARVVQSRMEIEVKVSILESTPTNERVFVKGDITNAAKTFINALNSASTFDGNALTTALQNVTNVGDVRITAIRVNGRTIRGGIYRCRDIEKLFTSDNSIFVTVV